MPMNFDQRGGLGADPGGSFCRSMAGLGSAWVSSLHLPRRDMLLLGLSSGLINWIIWTRRQSLNINIRRQQLLFGFSCGCTKLRNSSVCRIGLFVQCLYCRMLYRLLENTLRPGVWGGLIGFSWPRSEYYSYSLEQHFFRRSSMVPSIF